MKQDISIACSPNLLPQIRQFVGRILAENNLGEVEAYKLVLAVDEVCANLIIHANQCDESKKLNLSVQVVPQEKVVFIIKDEGIGFDFSKYQEPSLDEIVNSRRKGGLGLILVRRIMDKIEFTTEKNCNICKLEKHL
jgi:serine/threonine-protein kinase RsbW